MSPNPISIEGVRALFRIHKDSKNLYFRPVSTTVLQSLVDANVLHEGCFVRKTAQNSVDPFDIVKDVVIKDYSPTLEDVDLFAVLSILDFLAFLVSEDGVNLEGGTVFEFFKLNLESNQFQEDPAKPNLPFPEKNLPPQ